MGESGGKSLPAIGFLTVVRHEPHGLFGGYLILNATGRPLEFHCTAPVKASRAQEILFGPALEPYLFGEHIGQTLVARSQNQPLLICTDLAAALAVRPHVTVPVTLVLGQREHRLDPPHTLHTPHGPLQILEHASSRLAIAAGFEQDWSRIADGLDLFGEHFDLMEPFGRIREAIGEAQRSGR